MRWNANVCEIIKFDVLQHVFDKREMNITLTKYIYL